MLELPSPPLLPPDLNDKEGSTEFFKGLITYVEALRQQIATKAQNAEEVVAASEKIGAIKLWLTGTVPTGYLELNGQAVSRTTYAALFDLWGTTFGVGDGSTTFNVADMRDVFPIGASGTKAVGTTGGNATATIGTANLPPHTHDMGNHTHTMAHSHTVQSNTSSVGGTSNLVVESDGAGTNGSLQTDGSSAADTGTPSTNTTGNGGFANDALAVLNPYRAVKFIVRA